MHLGRIVQVVEPSQIFQLSVSRRCTLSAMITSHIELRLPLDPNNTAISYAMRINPGFNDLRRKRVQEEMKNTLQKRTPCVDDTEASRPL